MMRLYDRGALAPAVLSAAWFGYQDGVAGRGFSLGYERAGADEQLAYELMRLWVSNMREAGIAPPEWPREKRWPPAPVERAAGRARDMVGDAMPPQAREERAIVVLALEQNFWRYRKMPREKPRRVAISNECSAPSPPSSRRSSRTRRRSTNGGEA